MFKSVSEIPIRLPRATDRRLRSRNASGSPFAGLAVGVAHNPDAVSMVRGTNGGSRNAVPFRIIPERGQVPENVAKAPSKQS